MSELSDRLITIVARQEHQQLKNAVVRAAKAWRYVDHGRLATRALDDAIDVLIRFETAHSERLLNA